MKHLSRFNFRLLVQFFLIIFSFHILKDLKESIVVTADDVGAEVLPFIKTWAMFPSAIAVSYIFSRLYHRYGREKTFHITLFSLLGFYLFFAFFIYPNRDFFYLKRLHDALLLIFPVGLRGLIVVMSFWHYTLFYVSAELWSLLVLSLLFWGYINEISSLENAKTFYPLCVLTGNVSGIFSGQISYFLSHYLKNFLSWESTLQLLVVLIFLSGCTIAAIRCWLSSHGVVTPRTERSTVKFSFRENIVAVIKSPPLLCIALMVIGFCLTSNLFEVVWKKHVRLVHPDPRDYNAFSNQLTSLIGLLAVGMALLSRWLFQVFSWVRVAVIPPLLLSITGGLFFSLLLLPHRFLEGFTNYLGITPIVFIVLLGAMHYITEYALKYALFDPCKEMAFLSIEAGSRMQAKSIIDTIGSRLGKSCSSILYQFILIFCTQSSGFFVIGVASMLMMGVWFAGTKRLGSYFPKPKKEDLYPVADPS